MTHPAERQQDYERGLVLACLQRHGAATLPVLQHRLPKLDSGRINAALTYLRGIEQVVRDDDDRADQLARRDVYRVVA